MEFFSSKTNFDFVGKRRLAATFSVVLTIISIVSLATQGLNYAVDFTGGYLAEAGYPQEADLPAIRQALSDNGMEDAVVQNFGTSRDVLIRLAPRTGETASGEGAAEVSDAIREILTKQNPQVEVRRVEFVGAQVGEELKNDGGLAMLIALICIMIYVMIRFEWKFSMGAVVSLAHDVVITLGFLSVIQAEFDLTVLAALLAIIGYSLNDTIVVYDRVRENFRRIRKGTAEDITNISINETLSRTVMTGVTTLMVLFALFFLGGDVIHVFSLTLIFGIVFGTYSSVYVASSVVIALGLTREDLLQIKKEGVDTNPLP
ncbi:MAG TPA: protein translocase subunit SecF [Gammaproteobacteria bacterium]